MNTKDRICWGSYPYKNEYWAYKDADALRKSGKYESVSIEPLHNEIVTPRTILKIYVTENDEAVND